MKLAALLQIVLILATCVVPEGRYFLSGKTGCANDCCCTAASRTAGKCCCAATAKTEVCAAKSATVKGCSNCKSAVNKTVNKAADKTTREKCCSTGKCSHGTKPVRRNGHGEGTLSNCPCGGEPYEMLVTMMPRTQPAMLQMCCLPSLQARCVPPNEHSDSPASAPESPPPQSDCC